MNDFTKRTWAEISLDNLEHNINAIRATIPSGCRFLGVVKADAYGHGAVNVAERMEKIGVDYLAVACLDEGIQLREAGISLPVLILGNTPVEYTPELIRYNMTQAVTDGEKADGFSAGAVACGGRLKVHIKLDTGMSRLGFLCRGERFEDCVASVAGVCALPGLDAEGIFTHFAVSDEEGEENREYTLEQFACFKAVADALEDRGVHFRIRHCANSGATLNYPEMALDMVRPGILTYGYGDTADELGLKPCMSLKTRIAGIKTYAPGTKISYGGIFRTEKETRIAVIPVGYADGLFRSLSNSCAFLTEGRMAPQRGRICMDMCMIDISDIPEAHEGSLVELFGENARLEPLAGTAGTITYEMLCAVSKRIPRVYK